jgi:hypothetical protein
MAAGGIPRGVGADGPTGQGTRKILYNRRASIEPIEYQGSCSSSHSLYERAHSSRLPRLA